MTLTAESILDVLDRSAAADWQDFCGTAALEYHALRLIAVRSRAGDDWGVVLEAIRGSLINNTLSVAAGYWTKVYGSRVTIGLHLVIETRNLPLDLPERRNRKSVRLDGLEIGGPAGTLVGDDGMIERFHLRPGRVCNFEGYAESPLDTLAIRAYMAAFPGSLWRPAEIPAAFTGVEDGEILLVSDAFHHVLGPEILDDTREDLRALTVSPSASESYRSLAVAIASRDGSRFAPGASNLDWRKWAIYEDSDADPSLPPVGSPLPFVPRADVVQPEVPAIATGDATRDDHLRTLTGAFADLHQEGALRALVHRPDNALPAILLGYLSDATLAIKPQVGTGGDELRRLPPEGRAQQEEQDRREALSFSHIVEFVKWTMRALAVLQDPQGDQRLIQIASTHPVARVRYDAADAIVRPRSANTMHEYAQRPATGSRLALEGVASLLDHADRATDENLLRLAAVAVFKLDGAKSYDRLAPLLLNGTELKESPAARAILAAAGSAFTAHADPRWKALALRLLGNTERPYGVLLFFESYAPPEIAAPLGAWLRASVAARSPDLRVVRLLGDTGSTEAARYLLETLDSDKLDERFYQPVAAALSAAADRSLLPELEALASRWLGAPARLEAIREVIGRLQRGG